MDLADRALREMGFRRRFHTENVSHYQHDEFSERIDLLHAFRSPALAMLSRAERVEVKNGPTVPLAAVEDIIGLKLQALQNDPARAEQDWLDMRRLVVVARASGRQLDWELIGDYFCLFERQDLFDLLKEVGDT